MNSKKLKEEICAHLSERKKKEEAIIGLFFDKKDGAFDPGKYKNMYNTIKKNLKAMDDQALDNTYHNIIELDDKTLKNNSSKDIADMLKRNSNDK